MRKILLLLLIIISIPVESLKLYDGFPVWLKDNKSFTDQTSGITFIGERNGKKYFLVCDDIGKIHRISLYGQKVNIETINFKKSVEEFLNHLTKPDLEEIVYDSKNNVVYVSIEGNGLNFKDEVGIYKLQFKNNDVFSDEILNIEKLEFNNWNEVIKYTTSNIGFEGVAVSNSKIFLGLEGFQFGELFLDSTMIYVFDKNSKTLIKELSTKELKIYTICGLYAKDDYTLYGVDRNQQNFFEIKFNQDYSIKSVRKIKLELPVPNNKNLRYVAAIESITLDNENNVYLVDDPWKKYYVPSQEILEKLSETDRENFKKFIPLLFKYKLN